MKEKDTENRNMFFTNKEFDLEHDFAEEYLTKDLNTRVYIYQIDFTQTKRHSLYNETISSEKTFKKAIELLCKITLSEKEKKFFSGSFGYDEKIEIVFSVLEKELKEKSLEINLGDYVKYFDGKQNQYFEVTDPNNINTLSSFTKNYKPLMKKFKAVLIKGDNININMLENEK